MTITRACWRRWAGPARPTISCGCSWCLEWVCVLGFGTGSNGAFDALEVVARWRETGVAPDEIVTSHRVGNEVDRTHPACPYPKVAIYDGKGDPLDAASFRCGNPKW